MMYFSNYDFNFLLVLLHFTCLISNAEYDLAGVEMIIGAIPSLSLKVAKYIIH